MGHGRMALSRWRRWWRRPRGYGGRDRGIRLHILQIIAVQLVEVVRQLSRRRAAVPGRRRRGEKWAGRLVARDARRGRLRARRVHAQRAERCGEVSAGNRRRQVACRRVEPLVSPLRRWGRGLALGGAANDIGRLSLGHESGITIIVYSRANHRRFENARGTLVILGRKFARPFAPLRPRALRRGSAKARGFAIQRRQHSAMDVSRQTRSAAAQRWEIACVAGGLECGIHVEVAPEYALEEAAYLM